MKKLTPWQVWYRYKYLKSKHWREFRKYVYGTVGRRCCKCSSRFKVQIHHKNYDCLGKEKLKDVMVLCERHHLLEHEKLNERKYEKKNK